MCKWLDKRVLGFRQDVRSFIKSKTNQVAIATIIGAGVAVASGDIDKVQAVQLMVPALIGLFLKDSHAASQEKA